MTKVFCLSHTVDVSFNKEKDAIYMDIYTEQTNNGEPFMERVMIPYIEGTTDIELLMSKWLQTKKVRYASKEIRDGFRKELKILLNQIDSEYITTDDSIYFEFEPSDTQGSNKKRLTFKFLKNNNCFVVYHNGDIIIDFTKCVYHRWYKGKKYPKKYDITKVIKKNNKDIIFKGGIESMVYEIHRNLPKDIAINKHEIQKFISNVIKPYLIEHWFYKEQ